LSCVTLPGVLQRATEVVRAAWFWRSSTPAVATVPRVGMAVAVTPLLRDRLRGRPVSSEAASAPLLGGCGADKGAEHDRCRQRSQDELRTSGHLIPLVRCAVKS
jgi:hypothetical protein